MLRNKGKTGESGSPLVLLAVVGDAAGYVSPGLVEYFRNG